MDKQSVRIGVDKAYWTPITVDSAAALTYGTPIELKGLTEVIVTKNSTKLVHYSDDAPSETISQDGEVSVAFKLDGLSSEVKAAILGTTYSSGTGLYQEGLGEVSPYGALSYRSKKASGYYKYTTFLKGAISKNGDTSTTLGSTVTVQTDSYTYMAIKPVYYSNVAYGIKQSFHSDDENCPTGLTDALLIVPETGWFSSPLYVPVAPGTALSDVAGVSGASAGYIALSFSAPTGATSVYAQVKDPIDTTWMRASTVAAITAVSTSAVITGLTPGNTYDVRLVVIGGTKAGISNVDEDVVALAS